MGEDVLLVQSGVPVTGDAIQTDLQVENEEELPEVSEDIPRL